MNRNDDRPAPAGRTSGFSRFRPLRAHLIDFIKYGVVGVFGTALQTGTLLLYVEKGGGDPLVGAALGFILSLLFSYAVNLRWTFKSSEGSLSVLLRYTIVSCAGLALNLLILYLFDRVLGWWYGYGQAASIVLVPIHNFIWNKAWAFRSPPTREVR
ncbi:GtrA family protein [Saccharibacillus sp. CPCC 101409]|uniref:GtrA family protein n=1 Tax=Saccharibacillus sp. CPCC 101409 TaxID=3058041 RepID=UPI0026726BEF|nr:GtrA family protein [Saccharibacillus sp. CPCC 101409]MDO3412008.1 GtrA family protein [Saccharibacillus sp. CPCC 101409]